jgi:hypothetical protein
VPNYKYELDGGAICRIKMSLVKKAAAGAEPAAAVDLPGWFVSANASRRLRTRRRPRGFVFSNSTPIGDTGRQDVRTLFIPILTPAAFAAAAPATLEYGGETWIFEDKTPEG